MLSLSQSDVKWLRFPQLRPIPKYCELPIIAPVCIPKTMSRPPNFETIVISSILLEAFHKCDQSHWMHSDMWSKCSYKKTPKTMSRTSSKRRADRDKKNHLFKFCLSWMCSYKIFAYIKMCIIYSITIRRRHQPQLSNDVIGWTRQLGI